MRGLDLGLAGPADVQRPAVVVPVAHVAGRGTRPWAPRVEESVYLVTVTRAVSISLRARGEPGPGRGPGGGLGPSQPRWWPSHFPVSRGAARRGPSPGGPRRRRTFGDFLEDLPQVVLKHLVPLHRSLQLPLPVGPEARTWRGTPVLHGPLPGPPLWVPAGPCAELATSCPSVGHGPLIPSYC